MKLSEKLFRGWDHNRCKIGHISTEHVTELRQDIKGWYEKGLLENTIYERYLKRFEFDENTIISKYKSIIVIAVSQPIAVLRFRLNGNIHSAVIPPTYIYSSLYNEIESFLKNNPEGKVLKREQALLPLKLLAVRSGLGMYGRNNICYVPGMGSFHRLMAYYADIPAEPDNWQEAEVMERCKGCGACIRVCPTKCIKTDRFLIHAESCLTNFNEHTDTFPDWLNPDSHNALVGCMHCQSICPENKPFLNNVEEKACFSEEETKAILAQTPLDRLPEETSNKLAALDMTEYYDVLFRNLQLLIERNNMAKPS